MPNKKNIKDVSMLKEKVAKAKSFYFVDYKGLKSVDADNLRAKLSEEGAEVEVAKNTLMEVAMREHGIDTTVAKENLKGSMMTIFAYNDAVSPLKKLYEFAKTVNIPTMKLGFVDGRFYSATEVETLSKLPSRNELIARVLAGFNTPISGFVNVLSGTKKNLVYALKAVADKKQAN